MAKVFDSRTTEFSYIPILKNANTWGHYIFKDLLDFEEKEFIFDPNRKYIIFLRDPFERWVSGVLQHLFQITLEPETPILKPMLNENSKLDDLHLVLLTTIVAFDGHTLRQRDFLENAYSTLQRKNVIYFDVGDKNFSKNVVSFLYKSFGISLPTKNIHRADDNIFKVNMKKQIMKFLKKNPKYKENVISYYQSDYDFLKKCNFYVANRSNL